jgi:hypothetical protein
MKSNSLAAKVKPEAFVRLHYLSKGAVEPVKFERLGITHVFVRQIRQITGSVGPAAKKTD